MSAQTFSDSAPFATSAFESAGWERSSGGRWLGIGYERWVWIMAAVGIAVRLEQYLFNRSLWLDESMVVLNLLHRSFIQLTKPLDYQQFAPVGWLFAEKSCSLLFGPSELAFRLVAIVGGTVATIVVALLARRLMAPRGAAVAVALFALSRPLIYYSSELKPYGSDPAFCGVLWLLGFWVLRRRLDPKKLAILALVGAVLFWFSYPLLFVAAGFLVAVMMGSLEDRNWRRFAALIPVCIVWTASFGVEYMLILRTISHNRGLPHAYPFFTSPLTFSSINMALQSVLTMQQNPATLLFGVALFAAVIGGLHFWREDRVICCFLVLPLILALAASNRFLYPLLGQLYLFFAPALFILVGAGAEEICLFELPRAKQIVGTFFVLLFVQPLLSTANIAGHHMPVQELRPVLQYVQRHQQPADTWYTYHHAETMYQYYAEAYGLKDRNVVLGRAFQVSAPKGQIREIYQQDLSQLRGRRVWAIFTSNLAGDGVDSTADALHILDSMGIQEDAHLEYGAAAYLYDLRPAPAQANPPKTLLPSAPVSR